MRSLTVNEYATRWLKKGFPWIYPKEVVKGRRVPGEWAIVRSERGEVLGTALLDDGWLAGRVFRHGEGPVDEAWIVEQLDRAEALRHQVVDTDTDAYRLVHGENDGLPGVRVDRWGHHVTVILDSPALAPILQPLVRWLERAQPRGIHLCYRRDPRETSTRTPDPAPGLLAGRSPPGPVVVKERGLLFGVLPHRGPDVGLYTDMREVRAFLEPAWGGARVLNTFAYTGAFSVSAAYNGAAEVVSVDLSGKALERAEENFRRNQLDPSRHRFLAEDTFKALDRFRRTGERFDRIILDPPAFSRSKHGEWSARKDLPRLVAAAARVVELGGWILTCSNQGELTPKNFQGLVLSGFSRAGRRAQAIWLGSQGPDYPALSSFPEGRYLKVTLWRVW